MAVPASRSLPSAGPCECPRPRSCGCCWRRTRSREPAPRHPAAPATSDITSLVTAPWPLPRPFVPWPFPDSTPTSTAATAVATHLDRSRPGHFLACLAHRPAASSLHVLSGTAPTAKATAHLTSNFGSLLASVTLAAPSLPPTVPQAQSQIDTSAPLGCGLAGPAGVSPK